MKKKPAVNGINQLAKFQRGEKRVVQNFFFFFVSLRELCESERVCIEYGTEFGSQVCVCVFRRRMSFSLRLVSLSKSHSLSPFPTLSSKTDPQLACVDSSKALFSRVYTLPFVRLVWPNNNTLILPNLQTLVVTCFFTLAMM